MIILGNLHSGTKLSGWLRHWPGYINGIELQYMLKYMLNYIVRADDCDICWIVGFNLTFDVHKKPDTFFS